VSRVTHQQWKVKHKESGSREGEKSTSRRFGLDRRHLGRGPGVWRERRTG